MARSGQVRLKLGQVRLGYGYIGQVRLKLGQVRL